MEAAVEASVRDGTPAVKTAAVEPEAEVAVALESRQMEQQVSLLLQLTKLVEVLWAFWW